MKYFSDVTKLVYNTAEECEAAEKEAVATQKREEERREKELAERKAKKEAAAAERKAMAADIEAARKEMVEAQKKYRNAISAFVDKYGNYHYTSHSADDIPTLFSSLFDWL